MHPTYNNQPYSSNATFTPLLPPSPPPSCTISSYSNYDPSIFTSYYQDPNATVSSYWLLKDSPPITYTPISAVQPPLSQGAISSTSYDASLMSTGLHAYSVGYTPKHQRKLKKPKLISKKINPGQKVRCELCKIDCTSITLYEKHLSGKKHAKNLQKSYASGTTSKFVHATQPMNNRIGIHSATGGPSTPGGPGVTANLERKKHILLQEGAAVGSLRMCTVCNVACNGEIVYADHLTGKKHLAQMRSLTATANQNTNLVSHPIPKPQEKITKTKNDVSAKCEVCKISCSSSGGLIIHRQGKKHKKNLELLKKGMFPSTPNILPPPSTNPPTEATKETNPETQGLKRKGVQENGTFSSTPNIEPASSTNPPTAAQQNTEATKKTNPETQGLKRKRAQKKETNDIETKKQKVLEYGANVDAVRTCTICNVVCNSETVFKSHIAGQKHISMVKKAEAGTSTATSQQLDNTTTT